MLGRRSFLQLGPATLTGALVLDWNKAIGATGSDSQGSIGRGIVDERFAVSRTFGQTLAAHGVRTTAVGKDVARLWYDDLRPALQETREPFVGLTDRSTLFCLEELARDVGMKVVTRIDHLIERNGRVRHDAIGSQSLVDAIQPVRTGESFGQLTALLVMHDSPQPALTAAQKRTGPAAPERTTALVTWVIA